MTEERVEILCERLDIESLKVIHDDYRSRAEERFSQVDLEGRPNGQFGRQTVAADPNEDYVTANDNFQAMLAPYQRQNQSSQDDERSGPFNIAAYR
jgi:hypothetical protein